MNGSAIRSPQSDIELQRRARALARPPAEDAADAETLHLVSFRLGEERFGVDISRVREIRPLAPLTWSRVPCTPDFIVGAVNVRGRIYSVMDVARFMGLPSRALSEVAHVLLVRGEADAAHGSGVDGEMELGILADDVPRATVVPLSRIQPPPSVSGAAQPHVRGVTEDMCVVLDLESLLADPAIVVCEEVDA
jgi:purine-binding chemotaxis protein CheW